MEGNRKAIGGEPQTCFGLTRYESGCDQNMVSYQRSSRTLSSISDGFTNAEWIFDSVSSPVVDTMTKMSDRL